MSLCGMRNDELTAMIEHPQLRRVAAAFARYANLTFGGGRATVAVLTADITIRLSKYPAELRASE
jgi:hypothetical protein